MMLCEICNKEKGLYAIWWIEDTKTVCYTCCRNQPDIVVPNVFGGRLKGLSDCTKLRDFTLSHPSHPPSEVH